MPPLVFAPGQRSLISGSASMNALANSLCSSMPGRDREDVRVEDDVLGREADLVDEQAVRALADRDLPLDRVRLALLVERHHDDAGAVAAHGAGLLEEASSPSLRLIELTMPLPWRHLRPASRTLQFELSTMIGSRATSGSVATRLRKVVIACSPSSRSASMLTSRRFAPPRTCSSATSTRLLEVARLDQAAEARRAGDVRALADHDEVRVGRDRERLEAAEARRRVVGSGTRRGGTPSTAAAIARTCSGVVPQQPPTMFTSPSRAKSPRIAARVGRLLVVRAERVRQARVRVARTTQVVAMCERSSTNGRISVAPSAQLTPTSSGSACWTESQNASTVCPERVRPLLSTAVKESQSGISGASSSAATIAAFALSESKTVSIRRKSTPPSRSARICCAYDVAHLVERDRAVRRVVDTRRERERDVERADRAGDEAGLVRRARGPLVGGAAREPGALDVHLPDGVLEAVVGLADRRRGERVRRRDVRAGGEVVVVDPRDDLRAREVEQVGIAGDVARVVAEALAAVRVLAAHLALDEHAPGAVEHGDPLAEDCFEFVARVRHRFAPDQRPYCRERPRALGSLGVW